MGIMLACQRNILIILMLNVLIRLHYRIIIIDMEEMSEPNLC